MLQFLKFKSAIINLTNGIIWIICALIVTQENIAGNGILPTSIFISAPRLLWVFLVVIHTARILISVA